MKINFESLYGIVSANEEFDRTPFPISYYADQLVGLIENAKADNTPLYELIERSILKVRGTRSTSEADRTDDEMREFLAPEIDFDKPVSDEHAAARLAVDLAAYDAEVTEDDLHFDAESKDDDFFGEYDDDVYDE